MKIPNIIHFIFGLEKGYGGKPFSFIHFLSIYTAFKVHRPERIYFHYEHEPTGEWWERAKPFLFLNKLKAPTEIFGNRIVYWAHKGDVIRLEKLMEYGGIYLDLDVISINSFEHLRENSVVMGVEHNIGLCNAVILAEKEAEFLSIWYDEYQTFCAEHWNYHSVRLPFLLAELYPQLIHIVNEYSFFYPMYNDPTHKFLWVSPAEDNDLMKGADSEDALYKKHLEAGREWQYSVICRAYCLHLWESLWFKKYLQSITPESILAGSSNFSRLIQKIITWKELQAMCSAN